MDYPNNENHWLWVLQTGEISTSQYLSPSSSVLHQIGRHLVVDMESYTEFQWGLRSRGDGSLCPDTERHSPCSTPTHTRPPGVFVKCPGVASEERGGGLFTMAVSYAVIWTVQGAGGWRTGRMHTCPPQLPGPPAASRTPRPELQGPPAPMAWDVRLPG